MVDVLRWLDICCGRLFICLFVCLFCWLYGWLVGCLVIYLFVCLVVCLFVCLFIYNKYFVLYLPGDDIGSGYASISAVKRFTGGKNEVTLENVKGTLLGIADKMMSTISEVVIENAEHDKAGMCEDNTA